MKFAIVAVVVSLASAATPGSIPSPPLVLQHVAVIVGDGSPTLRNATLLIRDGRIAQVDPSGTLKPPVGSRIKDATGKFAIPGLWDMHFHLFVNVGQNPAVVTGDSPLEVGSNNHAYFFPLLVANGVVGVRDMFTDPDDIVVARGWNEETESGRLIGPRVMVGSRVVDGDPPNSAYSLVVRDPIEARQAVRTLKASGAGFIKVYWFLSRDAYFAIADESKRQGIAFAGHVPIVVSAAEASDAGQRTIEHNTGILEACSTREAEWLQNARGERPSAAEMLRTYDDARCEALAHRLAKNGTVLVPTKVNFTLPADTDLHSRLRYVSPNERERWMSAMKSRQALRQAAPPQAALRRQRVQQMTQAMRRAGVRFMTGTDLSMRRENDGFRRHMPGIGVHDELALMVEDGLTPREALQAAISNVAQYAGQLGGLRHVGGGQARRCRAARCRPAGGHR